MSFNHKFRQYLYLPSGGLSYPPDAFLSNITAALVMFEGDATIYNSQFEFFFGIIDKYADFKVDPLELYTADFYYIWSVVYSAEIMKSDKYYLSEICTECAELNEVKISFSKLKTKILSPYINIPLEKDFEIKFDNDKYVLTFNRRKVKHNLRYTYQYLNIKDQGKSIAGRYALMLSQQLKKVNGPQRIQEKDFYKFFMTMSTKDIIELFFKVESFNNDFGLNNEIEYECKKCKSKVRGLIFSNVALSSFSEMVATSREEKVEYYKDKLQTMVTTRLSSETLVDIPLKEIDIFSEAFKKVDITPPIGM